MSYSYLKQNETYMCKVVEQRGISFAFQCAALESANTEMDNQAWTRQSYGP